MLSPLVMALLLAAAAAPSPGTPLTMSDVIGSALERHPAIMKARSKIEERDAAQVEANGAFDTKLKGGLGLSPLGYYSRRGASAGVEQQLPLLGSPELFGGYRIGSDWAPYEGKKVTGDLGALEAGVRFQLSRDLFVDDDRFALSVARLRQAEARADFRRSELKLAEEAAKAYLGWTLVNQRLQIARALLQLAIDRQAFVERQVSAGDLPRIALVDNERQILARQEKVVSLERDAANAALRLGLYLRDAVTSEPVRVDGESVPPLEAAEQPTLDEPPSLRAMLDDAREQRPEFVAYENVRSVFAAEVSLARNDALPKVELEVLALQNVGAPQSYGAGTSRLETEAQGRLSFAWPVQMRKARGKGARARAKMRALDAEVTLLRDTIAQEVEAAHISYLAARERVELARRALAAAHRLEEAERASLSAGSSNLLSVNLREERAAESARSYAQALAEAQLASTLLALSTGTVPGR